MRLILKNFITVIIVLTIFSSNGLPFEKVGTTSFQFLKVPTDARATGMGEAYTAVVNTADAVFWNPAALTNVKNIDLSFSYLDYLLDVYHASLSFAYNVDGIGTFAVHALMTDVGKIEVTSVDALGYVGDTYNPGLTGETINPGALAVGLSFARELTDKFSFGLTSKYVREDLDVKAKATVVFDAGLLYRTGFRSLQLGAAVKHFGPEVKYVDESYPLPQTFTIGVSGYLLSPEGAFWMPSNNHRLLLAYDLSHPRDYTQQHHVGLEYSFMDLIVLRGGYKFNYDEEGFTFGFGLTRNFIRFDYSYADFGEFFDAIHRFTVGFKMN